MTKNIVSMTFDTKSVNKTARFFFQKKHDCCKFHADGISKVPLEKLCYFYCFFNEGETIRIRLHSVHVQIMQNGYVGCQKKEKEKST